jgi:hypothetical protein
MDRKINMFKMFNLKVNATGLSVFRIFYSLVLFCELLQLYKFRNIIYDKDPFVYAGEVSVSLYFLFLVSCFDIDVF